ncbi:transferase [Streptomyces sulfonofaciens]|uniref:Transferase n=1 Tax=Streptomyces sulfonofaciens TaxID=68272 RepID=A0A919FN03_9ACTN|nr:sugar transferase [Streptomyces sulfonofaciens]GHH69307.1 transferase [Streptomyces sulfonofaciens]
MTAESTVPPPAGQPRTGGSPSPIAVVRPRGTWRGPRPPLGPRRAVRHASPLPLLAVDTAAALLGVAAAASTARTGGLGWRAAVLGAPAGAQSWPAAFPLWPAAPLAWPALAVLWPTLALLLTVTALYARAGLYGTRGGPPPPRAPLVLDELPALGGRSAAGWVLLAALLAGLSPARALSLPALATGCAVHIAVSCAGRGAVHRHRRREAARHPHPTLVIGPAATALRVAAALLRHPACGLRPVGVAGTEPGPGHPEPGAAELVPAAGGTDRGGSRAAAASGVSGETDLPVLTTLPDVRRALIQNTVRAGLFVGADGAYGPLMGLLTEYHCLVWRLDPEPAAVAVPHPAPDAGAKPHPAALVPHGPGGPRRSPPGGSAYLAGFPCTPLSPLRHTRPSRGKRALDVTVSGLLLVLAGPVLLGCAAALRLIDGPGVVFRQERVGKDGHPFTLLKLRTHRPADPQEATTRWSIADEQGMSAFCRFLRRTSLDELLQLWNVFRGDMSLVGPRPERPHFVAKFSRLHPGYAARHRMQTGITGLAQIHGLRGDTSIEDRCRFDNAYIDTWSLWQDVCILLRTAAALVRPTGS